MVIPVTIGPLSSASARAWIAAARETLVLLRETEDLEVPADVVDAFQRYVDAWAGAAEASEEFLWSAEVDVAEVRHVGLHWARIATITRVGHPGLSTAGPEAAEFYDAVATTIATVLATSDDTPVSTGFSEVMPGFDERLGGDGQGEPIRVLVVDDNEDVRLLLRIALDRSEGFVIVGEAADGEAGVAAAQSTDPDVVVLDVEMPVMTGLEALPVLRETCPTTGVVVFSAADVDEKALAAGATAFLTKTASISQMLETVRAAAGEHRRAK